jgi:arylsulfatase A-like enzyme
MGNESQGRENLVLEATSRTAFRKGDWLMIPPYDGPSLASNVNIELGNTDGYQLYNLEEDLGQQNNLAEIRPEILKEMVSDFETLRGQDYTNTQKLELK